MRKTLLPLAIAMVLGSSVPASAQDAPTAGSADVGAFAVGFLGSSEHEFYDPLAADWQELNTFNFGVGLRGAFYFLDYLGAEAEATFMPAVTADGGAIYGARGHLIGQYPMKVTPFALAGAGAMGVLSDDDVLGNDLDAVMYAGVGARYAVWQQLSVRTDARLIRGPKAFSFGGETSHYEFTLGASWLFGGEEPEPAPEPPPADTDGDGIFDDTDQCVEEPEVVNGFEDEDGCPDSWPDTDGDGLADDVDSCKDEAEDADGFEDEDGCPDTDNDADGVADADDKCPDEAGPEANGGCPDTDRDGDSVVDRLDNCPDEPGTVENSGCAEEQLVKLKDDRVELTQRVLFETNSAKVKAESFPLLDNVAKVLAAHPNITDVEVAGHTDDRGETDFNVELSQQRAESVVAYLVEKGVEKKRLVAKGYGESKPRMEGTSEEARTANRRVEFTIRER